MNIRVYTEEEAKKLVGSRTCDHCGVKRTVRKRTLNSTMVRQLVALYQFFDDPVMFRGVRMTEKPYTDGDDVTWVHAKSYLIARDLHPECAKLRFWKLVCLSPKGKTDGNKSSGFVAITRRGQKFVRGEIKVHKAILTANQGVGLMGLVGEQAFGIRDAFGNHFNYNREIAQWSFERTESK